MNSSIKVKLKKIVKTAAILEDDGGREFFWPSAKLPEGTDIGDEFYLSLEPKPEAKQGDEKIAKLMLQEILNSSEKEEEIK